MSLAQREAEIGCQRRALQWRARWLEPVQIRQHTGYSVVRPEAPEAASGELSFKGVPALLGGDLRGIPCHSHHLPRIWHHIRRAASFLHHRPFLAFCHSG